MTSLLLLALGMPVGLASLVLIGARRPWSRGGREGGGRAASNAVIAGASRGSWAWGLALGMAVVASVLAQEGRFDWPPAARWHVVAYLAIAQGLVAGVAQRLSRGVLVHLIAAAGIGAIAGIFPRLPGMEAPLARWAVGGAAGASAAALALAARRLRGDWIAAAGVIVCAALSMMFMERHFAKAALAAAAVSATLAFGLVWSWARLGAAIGVGTAMVVGALIPTLAATGYAYDDAGPWRWTWGLAATAPLALLVAAMWPGRQRSASSAWGPSWRGSLMLLACVALVAAGAVVAQHRLSQSTHSGASDDDLTP